MGRENSKIFFSIASCGLLPTLKKKLDRYSISEVFENSQIWPYWRCYIQFWKWQVEFVWRKFKKKNFGIFSAHLRYLPIAPFLSPTQLAIFRIEYNAFSKAKFGNFQKLLKLNIYLQTIIIGAKTQFEWNLTSIEMSLGSAGITAIVTYILSM